jgi:hypothetical protein
MAGNSDDRMREALARLPMLASADLRAEWRRLYGTEAPARIGHDLLIGAIAYRLQEQALGGLRPELRRRMRKIVQAIRQGGEVSVAAGPRLKPGTRLIREWQGRTYEVLVGDDGYVWRQQQYRSLSEIARAITETRWSGPVFFGLKPRPLARGADGGSDAAI